MMDDGGTPELDPPAAAPERERREGDIVRRIVERVAASADGDVTDVVPLYDVLDPDALERLFRPSVPSRAEANLEVRFRYEGHVVAVYGDGDVVVTDDDDRPADVDADAAAADVDARPATRSPSSDEDEDEDGERGSEDEGRPRDE